MFDDQSAKKPPLPDNVTQEMQLKEGKRPSLDANFRPKSIDRYSDVYEDEEKIDGPLRTEDSPPKENTKDIAGASQYSPSKTASPEEQAIQRAI